MFGILNLNKPAHVTSRDVVNKVQRLLPRKMKVGHAGTLDPLATGVLLVCVGPATRLVPYLHMYSKGYEGKFLLGKTSPTCDVESEPTNVTLPHLEREDLQTVLPRFRGKIEQVPPEFSAVRVQGKRAYELARQGKSVELTERDIEIHDLQLTGYDGESFSVRVECSTGTYIRSLGRDIARACGTEAVMSELQRTSIGPFHVDDALSIEDLNQRTLADQLCPAAWGTGKLKSFVVSSEEHQRLYWGQFLNVSAEILDGVSRDKPLAILNKREELVALGVEKRGALAPLMVFQPA